MVEILLSSQSIIDCEDKVRLKFSGLTPQEKEIVLNIYEGLDFTVETAEDSFSLVFKKHEPFTEYIPF